MKKLFLLAVVASFAAISTPAYSARVFWDTSKMGTLETPMSLADPANWGQGDGWEWNPADCMFLHLSNWGPAARAYYFDVPSGDFETTATGTFPGISVDNYNINEGASYHFGGSGSITINAVAEWNPLISARGNLANGEDVPVDSRCDLVFDVPVNIIDSSVNSWTAIQTAGGGGASITFNETLTIKTTYAHGLTIPLTVGAKNDTITINKLATDLTAGGSVYMPLGQLYRPITDPSVTWGTFTLGDLSGFNGTIGIAGKIVLTGKSDDYSATTFVLHNEGMHAELLLSDGITLISPIGGFVLWTGTSPVFGTSGAATATLEGALTCQSPDGTVTTGISLAAYDPNASLILKGGITWAGWTKGLSIIGNGTVLLKETAITMNNGIIIGAADGTMGVRLGGNITLTGATTVRNGAGLTSIGGDMTFSSLDLSAMNTDGKLEFTLGSSNGTFTATTLLNIGNLNASEFTLFTSAGFDPELTYGLFFSSNAILGNLDTVGSIPINEFYQGQLAWGAESKSILLNIVAIPEPTSWVLLGVSLLVVTVLRRKKLS